MQLARRPWHESCFVMAGKEYLHDSNRLSVDLPAAGAANFGRCRSRAADHCRSSMIHLQKG
jgi:hypothetical protein